MITNLEIRVKVRCMGCGVENEFWMPVSTVSQTNLVVLEPAGLPSGWVLSDDHPSHSKDPYCAKCAAENPYL